MAKRYIDAEQFLKDQTKKWVTVPWIGASIHDHESLPYALLNAPTADVVEVVRCKDCVYWQDNNDGYPHKECRWGKDETPDAYDFCSYGERRTDDD
jgi:hypothetical protein